MNNLQRLRNAKGMTQAQLAAAVGVTPGAVGQYESGYSTPSLKTALVLASVLGCTVDDLFDRKEANPSA